MSVLRLSTQLHKWLALIIGVQVLFWVVGGLVMTAIPIERVRSEHRVAAVETAPLPLEAVLSPAEAARRAGIAPVDAQLRAAPRGPVWALKSPDGRTVVVDAVTGETPPPLTPDQARALAQRAYAGEHRAVSAELLAQAPQETGREGPLWRVDFDDPEKTTFYLSPQTGELVTRRSDLWRFYDFFWRLHIMDLESGEDFNHPLLVAATALTLVMAIAGVVLLWIRLARDLKGWRSRRRNGTA